MFSRAFCQHLCCVNPFPNKSLFHMSAVTCGKRRHCYPVRELSAMFIMKNLKFVIWERVYSLPNKKISYWSKFITFADDKINVTESLLWDDKKTLWEKEKMLVTSIFSFSCNVFKSFLLQVC